MADQLQKLQKDKPYRHVSVDFISPGEDKLPSSDDTKFNLKKMPSEQFTNKNISKVESEPQPRFGKASQIRYGSQLSTGDGSVKVPGVKEVDNADMKKPAKVLVIDTDADTGVQMDEDGLPQQKTFGHMQLSQGADEHYNRLRNSPNLGSPRGTTQPSVPSVTGPVKKSIRSHKSEQQAKNNSTRDNDSLALTKMSTLDAPSDGLSPSSTPNIKRRNGAGRDPLRHQYTDDEYASSESDSYGEPTMGTEGLPLPHALDKDVKGAILEGDLERLKVLVMRGADLRQGDEDNRTPLHWAAAIGSFNIVEFLVSQEVNINSSDRWETTPLEEAMNNGHHEIAQFFREHGGTMPHEIGNRLCHFAIVNDISAMQRMIEAGANIDSRSSRSRHTALHIASAEGHVEIVQLLLESGAQVNIVDRWGKTPLSNSIENGHEEVSRMLTEHGAVSIKRDTDAMELCKAAAEGKLHKVKAMLEWRGVNPDVTDYDWRTPLHVAAGEGRLEIVQYLISKGANAEFKDKWGFNAYQTALQLGHPEIADFLNHNAMFTLKTELTVDDPVTAAFDRQLDEDSQMQCCKRFGRNRSMMHTAFKGLLSELAHKGQWEFAEFWTVSPEFSVLQFCQECSCINAHDDDDLETRLTRFRNVSQGLLIEYNIFFGGSVLAKRRPAWFTHLQRLPQFSFFRSPMCKVAGLKTCLALPVSPDESLGEMLGAVILFGCEDREPNEEQVLPLMDAITSVARIVTGKARLPKELISKWEYAGIVCDSLEAQVELSPSSTIYFRAIAMAIGLLKPIFEWTESMSSDEHRACIGVLDSLAHCAHDLVQYPGWPELSRKLMRGLHFLVSVSPASRKETPVKGIAEEAIRMLEDSGVVEKLPPPYFQLDESPILDALRRQRDTLIDEFEEYEETHDVDSYRIGASVVERKAAADSGEPTEHNPKSEITNADVFKAFGKRAAPKAAGFGGGFGSMRRSPYGNVNRMNTSRSPSKKVETETTKCAKFINALLDHKADNPDTPLLSKDNLLKLHNCLDLDNKTHKGVFRRQWVVGSFQFYKFYRVFCPWEEVPRAIECVLQDLSGLMRDMSPVLRAFYVYTALVHYIHPFHDGNGRISRLLCNSILQAYGFVSVLQYSDKIITFEEYLHKLEACTEAYRNIRANMTVR